MPSIITRGGMSALGYGFSGSVPLPADGSVVIFAIGYSSSTTAYSAVRNKYTIATNSSTACGVGSASTGSGLGSAAGNGSRGIFALGTTATQRLSDRNKYTYSTNTSTAAGVSSASILSYSGSAAGNSTRGIFSLGYGCAAPTAAADKYTYATCTSTSLACGIIWSSCTKKANYQGPAVGTSTVGIFSKGYGCPVFCPCCNRCVYYPTVKRAKYTYSTCTSTTSGVGTASCTNHWGAAAGNTTIGIFVLGQTGSATYRKADKYTYSSCTSVAATSTPNCVYGASGSGNSLAGIFAIGAGRSGRIRWCYNSCTNTACGIASSSINSCSGSAVSWVCGVNSP